MPRVLLVVGGVFVGLYMGYNDNLFKLIVATGIVAFVSIFSNMHVRPGGSTDFSAARSFVLSAAVPAWIIYVLVAGHVLILSTFVGLWGFLIRLF